MLHSLWPYHFLFWLSLIPYGLDKLTFYILSKIKRLMIEYQWVNLILSLRTWVNEACNALGFCIFSWVPMTVVSELFPFSGLCKVNAEDYVCFTFLLCELGKPGTLNILCLEYPKIVPPVPRHLLPLKCALGVKETQKIKIARTPSWKRYSVFHKICIL